jgi:hypothetical protein
LCANAGIEKEHAPLESVAAGQEFVVDTQVTPESDTDPLAQVASALPL